MPEKITFPPKATYGELYGPAMSIKGSKQAAKEYLDALVAWSVAKGTDAATARETHLRNLGYIAGYYDSATQARVNRLFNTTHPVFGKRKIGPEKARKMGLRRGEALRKAH